MFAPASRRARIRLRLLLILATFSLSLTLGVPAAAAVEYPPGQFECGGSGVTGLPLPAGDLVLSGTVTDPAGNPIVGIRVDVRAVPDLEEGSTVDGMGSTTTDAAGEWEFMDVGDASYLISFDDFSQTWQSSFWTSSGPTVRRSEAELLVLAGASATADVALAAEQWVELSGTVADPTGLGLEGIEVRAGNRNFGYEFCALTSAGGGFTILVRAAEYAVRVLDPSGTFVDGFYDAASPPSDAPRCLQPRAISRGSMSGSPSPRPSRASSPMGRAASAECP